jgi:hypothetical protein
MKDQVITDDDNLEDKLREVWLSVSEDVLQSVFHEWMGQLEWVREHKGQYYIKPHSLNKNRISCSRDKEGGHNFLYPLYSGNMKLLLLQIGQAMILVHISFFVPATVSEKVRQTWVNCTLSVVLSKNISCCQMFKKNIVFLLIDPCFSVCRFKQKREAMLSAHF